MDSSSEKYEYVEHPEMKHIRFFISEATSIPYHFHHDFELFQVIEGSMSLTTAEENARLHAGEIALFNPYEFHALESIGKKAVLLVIQVNPDFCIQHFPAIKYMRFNTSNLTSAVPFNICLKMIHACYDLGYHYYSKLQNYELMCLSDLYRLFWYIVSYVPYTLINENELSTCRRKQDRFCRIIEYIQSHYTEKLTLTEIAEKENLSLTYLSHLFKRNINMNFQQYLTKLRLEKALFLLRSTDMPIFDIAISSGFSDSKYLNRHFMMQYGQSPKAFRKGLPDISKEDETSLSEVKIERFLSPAEGLQILRKHYHFENDLS